LKPDPSAKRGSGRLVAIGVDGLVLTFAILFLVSWAAQGIAEWSSFAHEQAAHGQVARL
jgi:hypothetical protein